VSAIGPEVWERLSSSRSMGDSLTARLAVPSVTNRLLAAQDSERRRHLLIQLQPAETELHDDQSRGVSVKTRELIVLEHGSGRYLDICCNDESGYSALDLIGGEIAVGLVAHGTTPARLVELVLAKWRRFWGELPRQMLSREEQLGLFAELWFLSTWLAPHIGVSEAVIPWRGPFDARHDFEWAGRSIEVKATTSVRGRIHRINGLDQLAPPENGVLMLFSLRLREEAGASNTLPGLVAVCRSQMKLEPDTLDLFEAALAKANYSPAYEEEYAKLKLRIVDEALFRVEQDFPRITAASFEVGVPSGVERVEYEVNLGGCDHLLIASTSEMLSLL
jgi:Putative  PD-(D/E)XK family member, (DUF4420)